MSNIEDLINATVNKEYNMANDTFHDIMKNKMADALEQQKISIASAVFNDEDIEDEDIEDEYIEDEDIEDEDIEDEDIEDDE